MLIVLSLQPEGPKVSKGRSESPLAASAEAEFLHRSSVDADGVTLPAALKRQTERVYCSFSLRERTKEHPRGVTPLGHLPFTVLRDRLGVPGQLKTAPCLGLCLRLARMRCSCGGNALSTWASPLYSSPEQVGGGRAACPKTGIFGHNGCRVVPLNRTAETK